MIGHALARADLLAMELVSNEGVAVDAPSRDTEGRELALLAFVLSACARPSYRPRRDATKFPSARSSRRRSPGSVWPVTTVPRACERRHPSAMAQRARPAPLTAQLPGAVERAHGQDRRTLEEST
jgi:hypothetical protein